ncbi:hypothetical protein ACHAXR_007810 [Thalassiosira sp. AJA248-18]
MTTTLPSSQSWDQFLHSSAISYVSPAVTRETSKSQFCPRKYYWNRELLENWVGINPNAGNGRTKSGVSTINYGAYMLMVTFLAQNLSRRLSLVVSSHDNDMPTGENPCNDADSTLRVGIAIPEGPFLPLFILAVHSLNISVGEDWMFHDNQNEAIPRYKRCKGIVLIPMETDEAPERLKHMISDSSPNIILVAPGKDWNSMENVVHESANQSNPTSSSIELVDYTQMTTEALSSIHRHMQQNDDSSFIEHLWPSEMRDDSMDSLWYSHALPGCYDVPRLVAMGCVKLLSTSSSTRKVMSKAHTPPSKREIMSHIVYTSGTTGKPKGCVSSLASLQHYIRAKNLAHGIDSESNILLASAITFDPCFSDILATCVANATLCMAPREQLYGHGSEHGNHGGLTKLLRQLEISHVLCTPTLWSTIEGNPHSLPSLKVIALGGEPIPKAIVGKWARSKRMPQDGADHEIWDRTYPRLYATYGVTEACVYQTCGEVALECGEEDFKSRRPGQSVGLPLLGTRIHICHLPDDEDVDQVATLEHAKQDATSSDPTIGEVVLSGSQVDAMSSYLHLHKLTSQVFVQCCDDELGIVKAYRTGDLGYVEPKTGNLHLLGRIKGDGMVKLNGIRIELAEIENSIIDDGLANSEHDSLVEDCMAATTIDSSMDTENGEHQNRQLIAYCLLSALSISEIGIPEQLENGVIVPPGPLLSLLRARCGRRVKKGCTPSFFVLIDRLPLSATGKRNRSALPNLTECTIMGSSDRENISLWNYGTVGRNVANQISVCLNLQPCQRQLVTVDANFFDLGGDSLAATRVVRGLYAQHHGILDSRNLGGATGTLDGPYAAKNLLQSKTLGNYVKFLDSKLDSRSETEARENLVHASDNEDMSDDYNHDEVGGNTDPLYHSLIEAISLGYTTVASALLAVGVDPNSQPNKGRLGKVTDRKQQRTLFKSNPLHLACLRGNPYLVKQLLSKGCKANAPDASGSFPIHLACSRSDGKVDNDNEDRNRLECVKLLLDSGSTPIAIKDGNKQTVLICAARSGWPELLKYIMCQWKIASETKGIKFKSHNNIPGRIYDWHDRWFRTPVHWAVLNGRTAALRILLEGGCSAFPPKPKAGVSKRTTSVIIETPLEMSLRLYGESHGIGKEISCLLMNADY